MILTDIRDQCRVRGLDAQPAAQQTTARCLEYRRVHFLLAQDRTSAAWTGPVVTIDNALVDGNPVGRADTHVVTRLAQNVLGKTD